MLIPNVTSMPQAAVASFEYVINVGQSHLSVVSQSQTPSCLHFCILHDVTKKSGGEEAVWLRETNSPATAGLPSPSIPQTLQSAGGVKY